MATSTVRRRRISSRRIVQIAAASVIAVLLAAIISHLPKFELLEAAINDDNFTDLVQKTRGDLPIDSTLMVVTYDETMLDSFDMVDRSALATGLAALLELKPHALGVDFLIETERPEAPDGDEMLAALIADNPNLLFGVFYEDSLRRFRLPPARFNLRPGQLGCINVKEDEDRTIRTFTTIWGEEDSLRFESFDLKLVSMIDSAALEYLASFGGEEFVIDYAAGIGETPRSETGEERIFPVIPLATIFQTMMSGDSAAIRSLRELVAGRTVLVGYGDIGNTQVTSVVDRFYTPLREDGKNTLPDMHGVTIHANIVNTILQRRIVEVMPLWVNLIWGAAMVILLLAGREALQTAVPNPSRRTALSYSGFALLFLIGTLLPIIAFRYTPYKFSIYTPLAGLLLAVPALEGLERGMGLIRDIRRRQRLRERIAPELRGEMLDILKAWNPEERTERAVHVLQLQFHRACAVLFDAARRGSIPAFDHATVASPSLQRVLGAIGRASEHISSFPPGAAASVRLLETLNAIPSLQRTLRFSRSLYIAVNEIRRQSHEAASGSNDSGEDGGSENPCERTELAESIGEYTDLALKALGGTGNHRAAEEFDELYAALEGYAVQATEIVRDAGGNRESIIEKNADLFPFILSCRCQLHGTEERFVYFGEQEDANNRDDFFDLVYAGRTVRCQPESHPGLTKFRELGRAENTKDT